MVVGKSEINPKAIDLAIEQAEHGHRGEIFPLILKQSDFYPAAHFRCALLLGLSIPMAMYYLPFEFPDPIWYLWAQIPALILGYLLCYHAKFKKFFTTKAEIEEEVYQKSVESFLEFNLNKTKNNTGVLIMISLLERRVKILADHGFDKIMSEKDWHALAITLSQEVKKGNLQQGLITTIESIGKIMSLHFPLREGEENTNEVPNSIASHTLEKSKQANLQSQD